MADKLPHIIGQEAEILDMGKWKHGKIIDYRSRDGVVTIETDDGEKLWCFEGRTDMYRPVIHEMTREEKITRIARYYGYDSQSRQCIEEMAELTQAISKYWRKDLQLGKHLYNPWDGYIPEDSEEYHNLVEEIADVEIMLAQMKFFLAAGYAVEKIIDGKLDRQLARMEEELA